MLDLCWLAGASLSDSLTLAKEYIILCILTSEGYRSCDRVFLPTQPVDNLHFVQVLYTLPIGPLSATYIELVVHVIAPIG